MARRGENIRKRKDGRWEGRYPKGRDSSGKIVYGSVYAHSYREVKERQIQVTKSQQNSSAQSEMHLHELMRLWLDNNRIRYKGATEKRYRFLIETHIVPELGNIPLKQLTAPKINAFLMQKLDNGRIGQSGGLSPAYVRSIRLVLCAALRFAVREQLCLPLNSEIYQPVISKEKMTILTHAQQKKLEHHLLQTTSFTGLGVLLSLHTGLRIGEICALRWQDIDFEHKILHVRHTVARIHNDGLSSSDSCLILDTPKTATSLRDIPVVNDVNNLLKNMRQRSEVDFVVSDTPRFVSPRTFDYRYHKILSECGLPAVNFHTLRHTFATRCIEAGVDVKSLSEILGHANVGITLNTYVHSSMDLKRTQMEKLSPLTLA